MSLFTSLRTATVSSLALSLVIAASPSATAGTRLDIGSLAADGLAVHDLSCDVEAGGFMAGIGIVGALAGQRDAIAKCGPAGEAARLSFVFTGSATTGVKVLGASSKAVGACVAKALAKVKPSTSGTCTATILTVPNDAAKAAAAALSPKKAAEPVKPKEPLPAKEETAKTEPAKKAPAKSDAIDTTAAGLLKRYSNDDNWITFTVDTEGWSLGLPAEMKQTDHVYEVEDEKWELFKGAHDHLTTWVFYSPTAPLTAPIQAGMVAASLVKGAELEWSEVTTKAAVGDMPEMIVEKAFRTPFRFIRFTARGTYGSHVIITTFLEQMPDDIVVKWITSVKFFAPGKAEAEE